MIYRRTKQVKVKKIGHDTALYVRDQKAIHVLNKTALFIWELLEDPFTFDELLYMLTEAFDEDPYMMQTDLQEILNLFLRYDLVHTKT